MNRRELLTVAGAAVVVAASTTALAEEDHAGHEHAGHEHGGHDHVETAPAHQKLIDLAADCIKTGQACLNHCLETFAAGDTAMAGCARSVDQMLVVCATLGKLAVSNSSHLGAAARLAAAVCEDCEKECRKHADHHAVCKACAEACAACAEECKKHA